MTTKKFLSEKKVSQQTISLSPALKDWIERYVRVMHKKNPEDNRYKSISAFICDAMERVLKIFEMGKSLDDFKNIADTKIQKFYDRITFRALIPYYEEAVYLNKYQETYLRNMVNLFMMFKNQLPKDKILTLEKVIKLFGRFKYFMLSNNVSKDLIIETDNNKCIIQYFGIYPNIHFDFSKFIAVALGILGLKIKKLIYSKNYTRFDLQETYLLKDQNPLTKERGELFNENLRQFTNYYKIINDDDSIHLWMKMAKNKDGIISFREKKKSLDYIYYLIEEIENNSNFENRIPTFIKLIEHFGWIQIVDREEDSFICKLNDNHEFEKDILKTVIDKMNLSIKKKKNLLYLE